MDPEESAQYQARMVKRRGDVEVEFDLGEGQREAIMKCLERGELRMVLQNVDLDRLSADRLGGGYLWD